LQDTFDLKDDALLKASGALTGGIGGLADTCGSMIGAAMVLGSVYGRGHDDAGEKGMRKLGESIRQAADFFIWFKGKRGTVNCRDIVTKHGNGKFYNFGIPEEAKAAWENGVAEKCVELVQDNAAEAADILWDELRGEGGEI
jgi:C_GCAxxG_C_C family probable redox protein